MMSHNKNKLDTRAKDGLEVVNDVEKNEILDGVKRSYLWSNSSTEWTPVEVKKINNTALTEKFQQKKLEIIGTGCAVDNCETIYGFALERETKLKAICCNGAPKGRPARLDLLGNSAKGFRVTLHPDVLLNFADMQSFKSPLFMMVYKVVLGRVKVVPLNWGDRPPLQPTLGCDAHVPAFGADRSKSFGVNVNNAQVYLYDINKEGLQEDHPRQVLPYAVVVYAKEPKVQKPIDRVLYRFPMARKRSHINEDPVVRTPGGAKKNKPDDKNTLPEMCVEEQLKQKADAKAKLNVQMEASKKLNLKLLQSIKQLKENKKVQKRSQNQVKEKSHRKNKEKLSKSVSKAKSPKNHEKKSKKKAAKVKTSKKSPKVTSDKREDDFVMVEGLVSEDVMDFAVQSDFDEALQADENVESCPQHDTQYPEENNNDIRRDQAEPEDIPQPSSPEGLSCFKITRKVESTPLPLDLEVLRLKMEGLVSKKPVLLSDRFGALDCNPVSFSWENVINKLMSLSGVIHGNPSSPLTDDNDDDVCKLRDLIEDQPEDVGLYKPCEEQSDEMKDFSGEEGDAVRISPHTCPNSVTVEEMSLETSPQMPDLFAKPTPELAHTDISNSATEPDTGLGDLDKGGHAEVSEVLPIPGLFIDQVTEPVTESVAGEVEVGKSHQEDGSNHPVEPALSPEQLTELISELAREAITGEVEVGTSLPDVSKLEMDIAIGRDDNNNVDISFNDADLHETEEDKSVLIVGSSIVDYSGEVMTDADNNDAIIVISDGEDDNQEDTLAGKEDIKMDDISGVPIISSHEHLSDITDEERDFQTEMCESEEASREVFDVTVTEIQPFSVWSIPQETLPVLEHEVPSANGEAEDCTQPLSSEQTEVSGMGNTSQGELYSTCLLDTDFDKTLSPYDLGPGFTSATGTQPQDNTLDPCIRELDFHTSTSSVCEQGTSPFAHLNLPIPQAQVNGPSSQGTYSSEPSLFAPGNNPLPDARVVDISPVFHQPELNSNEDGRNSKACENPETDQASNTLSVPEPLVNLTSPIQGPGYDPDNYHIPIIPTEQLCSTLTDPRIQQRAPEAPPQSHVDSPRDKIKPKRTNKRKASKSKSVPRVVEKRTKPKTAGQFHGRTLLFGHEVPPRKVPLDPLYLKFPLKKSGKPEVIPKDPRPRPCSSHRGITAMSLPTFRYQKTLDERLMEFKGHPSPLEGDYPSPVAEDYPSPVSRTPSDHALSVATVPSVGRTDEDSITNSYMEDLINKAVENPNEVRKMLVEQEDRRAVRAEKAETEKAETKKADAEKAELEEGELEEGELPEDPESRVPETVEPCEVSRASSSRSSGLRLGFYSEIIPDDQKATDEDYNAAGTVQVEPVSISPYTGQTGDISDEVEGLHDNRVVTDMELESSRIEMEASDVVIFIDSEEDTALYDEDSEDGSRSKDSVFSRLGRQTKLSERLSEGVVDETVTGGRLINPPIPSAIDSSSQSSSSHRSVVSLRGIVQSKSDMDFSNCPWSRSSKDDKSRTLSPAFGLPAVARSSTTSRPRAPSSRPQAPSSRPQAPSSRPQAPSSRPQAPSSRPRAPTSRPRAPTSRPRAPSSRHQAPGSRPRAPSGGLINPPLRTEEDESSSRKSVFKRISEPRSVFSRIGDRPNASHLANQASADDEYLRERHAIQNTYRPCLPSIFDSPLDDFSRRIGQQSRPNMSASSVFDCENTDRLETWGVSVPKGNK